MSFIAIDTKIEECIKSFSVEQKGLFFEMLLSGKPPKKERSLYWCSLSTGFSNLPDCAS